MLPVAILLSLGDQLTAKVQLVWPFNVCTGVHVSQSHILAVLSPLPLIMREEPLGENWVAKIASPWPVMLAAHRETA
jgi:energy-converting hydrogenase Eha subunit A